MAISHSAADSQQFVCGLIEAMMCCRAAHPTRDSPLSVWPFREEPLSPGVCTGSREVVYCDRLPLVGAKVTCELKYIHFLHCNSFVQQHIKKEMFVTQIVCVAQRFIESFIKSLNHQSINQVNQSIKSINQSSQSIKSIKQSSQSIQSTSQ